MRFSPRAATVAVILTLLVGCSTAISGHPVATSVDGTQPPPPELKQYYTQQLAWGPCDTFARTPDDKSTYMSKELECSYLEAPVSYDSPATGGVKIGLLRAKATGQSRGSVLFNPGGPGASGMSFVAQLATYGVASNLREHFDLIGFDPRGIGSSIPEVDCLTGPERDAQRAANLRVRNDAELAAANDYAKKVAGLCATRTGAQDAIDGVAFLGSVGVRDVARDMDIMRAVLGDSKLNYVGFSYGTRIGTAYAEQFPRNTRTMVLDGAVDSSLSPGQELVNQAESFQKAFGAYAQWCAGEGNCPLGNDAAKATESYQKMVRKLLDKPLKLADGRVLTFSDATTGTALAMYSEARWPELTGALEDLLRGKGEALMKMADSYYDRDAGGHYSSLNDAFLAVRCVDDTRPKDDAERIATATKYAQVAPFFDSGDPVFPTKDSCDFWPAPPTSTPHTPTAEGLAPVLVISTTGDPATPYQAGVNLAKDLKGRLITVEGTRHTAYLLAGIGCVDRTVDKYIIDGELPADGLSCK